jgi:hypothetical protein
MTITTTKFMRGFPEVLFLLYSLKAISGLSAFELTIALPVLLSRFGDDILLPVGEVGVDKL